MDEGTFIRFVSDTVLAREAIISGDRIKVRLFYPTDLTYRPKLTRIWTLKKTEIPNTQWKYQLKKYSTGTPGLTETQIRFKFNEYQ